MLRTTLVALSCMVMLFGCSKEETAAPAKDQPESAAQPAASNETKDAPAQPSSQDATSDQPKDAQVPSPTQPAASNETKDPTPSPSTPAPVASSGQTSPAPQAVTPAPAVSSGHVFAPPAVSIPPHLIFVQPPRKVVENFYSEFSSGRIDDAMKCLSARYIAAEGGPQKIRSAYALAEAMLHSGWRGTMRMGVQVKNEEFRGQIALVHALVNSFDGKGAQAKTHRLIRENNVWKIDAIDRG
jgi:hypothetical protein